MADVREWLRKHEVSQRALSMAAGIHPTHMNRWVRGHSLPSLENQMRLREAMDGFSFIGE